MRTLLVVFFIAFAGSITAQNTNLVKLYRYYNISSRGHFYTTNFAELGNGNATYKAEGVAAYVFSSPADETFPVYRYYSKKTKAHFYTMNYEELKNGNAVFVAEGIAFYAYKNEKPGTRPFYRYYHTTGQYHFYTASFAELGSGKDGYVLEGNIGYVYATEEEASAALKKKVEVVAEKAPVSTRPALSAEEKAKHVLTVLHLAYEAWNSSNPDYREPADFITDAGTGKITGRLYLTPLENQKYAPISLNWENDQITGGILYTYKFTVSWENERVSNVKAEYLSDFDYTITYDNSGKVTGLVCTKLINGSIQVVKETETDGDKIKKITSYESPVNGPKWIRSVKNYTYTDKDVTIEGVVYKTGKPNIAKNTMPFSGSTSTAGAATDNNFISKTGWGATIETKYDAANRILQKKVTQNNRTEEHTYAYADKKLFRETTLVMNNSEFAEKTVQVYDDLLNAAPSLPIYESTKGVYKFDKAGDMIWEAHDLKYREKKDGVWSEWKNFRY